MLESYEEYLERLELEDKKESWIKWKMDVYKYPKEKARKRAESQYYPLSPVDLEQTTIGLNIRYLRKMKRLTLAEMSRELSITDNCLISRWERGIYIPDASQTKMLSEFFNVKTDDLIKRNFEQEHYQLVLFKHGLTKSKDKD